MPRDSVVGIATRLRPERLGVWIPLGAGTSSLPQNVQQTLGHTQPSTQDEPGSLPGGKATGTWKLNNPEANNEYSYASIQSIYLDGVDSDSIIVYVWWSESGQYKWTEHTAAIHFMLCSDGF